MNKASDGPLRQEFSRVLRDIRAGKPRSDSLRDLGDRVDTESIRNVVSSIIQAEKTGSSLGPVLKAQADQLRSTRFQKAEKLAMEAPVKLLGPLVMFIFPNTFLIIIFVILSSAIQKGVLTWAVFKPLVLAFNWPG
ncbi:MAG: type II secretion system F family protein [Candidatus Thiodiazotropha taylori]|nr:type II secretion system F family protein [Candidatus Thiodiazotropha taylori]MCG7884023.1 type II secretion system F family protein [Candidatus Thiodiazotropha taylori]MCG8033712.1 type II secretion system F family protein [Candidatus Thiodiazotropha taylori]MCG8078132.1 type II secretion system F family protein [Candidatus Thiodiazotropha taylori]